VAGFTSVNNGVKG